MLIEQLPATLEITLDDTDFTEAECGDATKCVMAQALMRTYPLEKGSYEVFEKLQVMGLGPYHLERCYSLSPEAKDVMEVYDAASWIMNKAKKKEELLGRTVQFFQIFD